MNDLPDSWPGVKLAAEAEATGGDEPMSYTDYLGSISDGNFSAALPSAFMTAAKYAPYGILAGGGLGLLTGGKDRVKKAVRYGLAGGLLTGVPAAAVSYGLRNGLGAAYGDVRGNLLEMDRQAQAAQGGAPAAAPETATT